jgi:hypothetical protein
MELALCGSLSGQQLAAVGEHGVILPEVVSRGSVYTVARPNYWLLAPTLSHVHGLDTG